MLYYRCFFVYLKRTSNISALAVKNIEASFIFLARLFVYLWQLMMAYGKETHNHSGASLPVSRRYC